MDPFLGAGTDTVSPHDSLLGIGDDDEGKKTKGLPHGIKPSKKEVEEHERTHLPFRSWCEHCVNGKAKSHPHFKKDEEEIGIPTISWDYFYMKDEEEEDGEADEGERGMKSQRQRLPGTTATAKV